MNIKQKNIKQKINEILAANTKHMIVLETGTLNRFNVISQQFTKCGKKGLTKEDKDFVNGYYSTFCLLPYYMRK